MRRIVAVFLGCVCCVVGVFGQEAVTVVGGDVVGPLPATAQFGRFEAPVPSLATGAVTFLVDLYVVRAGEVEIPLRLCCRTQGVRVWDDPYPCGYGWSLLPSLRVTRTVLGRPDELYRRLESGRLPHAGADNDTLYRCVRDDNGAVPDSACLDTRHDLFTLALPGANFNFILERDAGGFTAVAARNNGYRVSADERLGRFVVTDPLGNRWQFGGAFTETVLFSYGHEIRYAYAADGRKLRAEYLLSDIAIIGADKAAGEASTLALDASVTAPGVGELPAEPAVATLMTRDYCGSHIYRNGRLERTLTDGGYMQDGELYFYIKDYQGNVRAVLNQQNQPVELTSYYPYGGIMAATAAEGVQPHKYGGKELDRQNGLNWYDSRARWYDPLLGRTPTQDPKAESYPHLTPYLWCAANPIRLTDPNGMDYYQVDSLGNFIMTQRNNDNYDKIFSLIDGNLNSFIEVEKAFMASEKTETVMQHSPTYGDSKVKVSTYHNIDAKRVYNFVKEHTIVEWTLINNVYLGTSHDKDKDVTASYLLNQIQDKRNGIFEMRHIPPGGGKTVSEGDIIVAKDIQTLFPSAKLFIDIPSRFGGSLEREYDQYDIVGVLEEVFCVGKKIK